MKNWKLMMLAILTIFTVGILAACGSDSEESSNNDEEKEETNSDNGNEESEDADGELEGSVVIDGSGTVYPLMSRLADHYMSEIQQGVSVEVSRAGTSAGFGKFLIEDGTDFNDASRPIKEEEQATAEELGIEVMEIKVALDGLTIVVHPDNDFATELTADQVQDIFLGNVTKWSEINADWPEEEIQTYGPNENHGTYEFFFEEILEEQDLTDTIELHQDYSTLVT